MYGQESNRPDISEPIISEFITEAKKRNVELKIDIKGIYFLPAHEFKRYIGTKNDNRAACVAHYPNYLMGRYEPMILVDSIYFNRPDDMKAFIYHELGHIFGLKHDNSKTGIMNSAINRKILTEEHKDRFFKKIKNIDPRRYYKISNFASAD